MNKLETTFTNLYSFVKRIVNGIKKRMHYIKTTINNKKSIKSDIHSEKHIPTDSLDNDESYNEYSKKIATLDDVVVKLGLHERISASHKYMYEMGRRDGSLGVELKNIVDIAKATAQEVFRHVYVLLKGSLASLSAHMDTMKGIMDYDDDSHQRDQIYYDYVKFQYRFFPRSYSWFLCGFYLIISLLLIIADIPLALKLIHDGFNLTGSSREGETIAELFTGNFWHIIAINWETFTTALGISLCTIYIKIYYDDFIGTPYANKLMTHKRFIEENKLQNQSIAEDSQIKKEYTLKQRWKTGLAIFTLLCIFLLALFRLQTAVTNKSFDVTFASGLAFIAITLLFPVIAGICISHALTNFQNMVRFKKARLRCIKSRKKYLHSVEHFKTAQKNHEDIKAACERWTDEDRMTKEYQDYLMAFYNRGLYTGSMQPDKYTKGEDFFSKVMEWRNIAISRKMNHHISKLY